jgi:hypothetical protein
MEKSKVLNVMLCRTLEVDSRLPAPCRRAVCGIFLLISNLCAPSSSGTRPIGKPPKFTLEIVRGTLGRTEPGHY